MLYSPLDGRVRCARRGCSNWFLPNPKAHEGVHKYCCNNCKQRAYMHRKGSRPLPFGECPKGHVRTPENTYVHKGRRYCMDCRRAAKHNLSEAAKQKERERKRRYYWAHREEITRKARLKYALGDRA